MTALVAGLEVNLLSVSQFADKGFKVLFNKEECTFIRKKTGEVALKGARKGSLFIADFDSTNKDGACCFYTKASEEQKRKNEEIKLQVKNCELYTYSFVANSYGLVWAWNALMIMELKLLHLRTSTLIVILMGRFQCNSKELHLMATKRIFRYLKGTPNLGLWYPKGTGFEAVGYTDADFAGYRVSRKSTGGSCKSLGQRLVSCYSKKQQSVSPSIAVAKYIAVGSCCAQVLWIRNQLMDYGLVLHKIPIMCDNTSAISIVANPVNHSRTKHNDVRYHFSREHAINDVLGDFWNTTTTMTVVHENQAATIVINYTIKGQQVEILEDDVNKALGIPTDNLVEAPTQDELHEFMDFINYSERIKLTSMNKKYLRGEWLTMPLESRGKEIFLPRFIMSVLNYKVNDIHMLEGVNRTLIGNCKQVSKILFGSLLTKNKIPVSLKLTPFMIERFKTYPYSMPGMRSIGNQSSTAMIPEPAEVQTQEHPQRSYQAVTIPSKPLEARQPTTSSSQKDEVSKEKRNEAILTVKTESGEEIAQKESPLVKRSKRSKQPELTTSESSQQDAIVKTTRSESAHPAREAIQVYGRSNKEGTHCEDTSLEAPSFIQGELATLTTEHQILMTQISSIPTPLESTSQVQQKSSDLAQEALLTTQTLHLDGERLHAGIDLDEWGIHQFLPKIPWILLMHLHVQNSLHRLKGLIRTYWKSGFTEDRKISELKISELVISELKEGYASEFTITSDETQTPPKPTKTQDTQNNQTHSRYESIRVPILRASEYPIWKVKMAMFLEATDPKYLDRINDGPYKPTKLSVAVADQPV
ncbi:hypothetical protein AgCh_032737 [Apium graveolens]